MYRIRTLSLLSVALVVLAVAAHPAPAGAATYVITTLEEDDVANGNCTLREALLAASTDSTHDLCIGDVAPDTIVLEAIGTYDLDGGNIFSAARQITVRGAAGQPASAYVVDLGNAQRFLEVLADSELTLENLTLFDGFGGMRGGAVMATDSDLTLRGVTISGSEAGSGGAVAFVTFENRHLEVTGSTFSENRSTGNQSSGGAVEIDIQAAGSARILATSFLDNRIDSATGTFARTGAGLSLRSFDGGAVELRHLRFLRNVIAAPSFSMGAGARLHVSSTDAPFVLEDAFFEANEHEVEAGTNGPAGLDLRLNVPVAAVRRVRLLGNLPGTGRDQAVIQVNGETQATISDLLVANGESFGLFVSTSGSGCSLVAGNLTVAGHPGTGVRLSEGDCPLRLENSILFGNGTASGTDLQIFNGSPEVSAENLIDVDPEFVDAAGGDFTLGPGSVAAESGFASLDSVGPFDAAHGTRVLGAQLDLGAFERGSIFADGFERGDLHAWSPSAE